MEQDNKPVISVVAPIFNESATLPEFYRRVREALQPLGETWELVLIDDGSRDNSSEIMRELARQDPRVRPVIFARNFGHQLAVTAGLDYSRGEAVVIIDSDLQDPPEVIPEMIARWREGYEVVYAIRTEREGETWFKLFTASLFYRLIYRITDVDIPLDTGDFRLLDRKVVNVLNSMRERHRFLRGMSVWVGFRQTGVSYKRHARFAGETKYPLKKMVKFASDAVTGFSYFPLQLATYVGFFSAGISILAIPIVIIMRLIGQQAFFGQATTLIAVLFLGGVQLISLGILGEYIGRLYDEARGRPLYIVRDDPQTLERERSKLTKIEI
ncbi:MAG: glycosyltransferase family 2 protein [Anaerolineales bacterium]|nr:glycosyltransferase family 2 protein [Anaerolineales bacterium]